MKLALAILTLCSMAAFAEPTPEPTLGPATTTALQALENQINQARQQEQLIMQEWAQNHPGYSLTPGTFQVRKMTAPSAAEGAPGHQSAGSAPKTPAPAKPN